MPDRYCAGHLEHTGIRRFLYNFYTETGTGNAPINIHVSGVFRFFSEFGSMLIVPHFLKQYRFFSALMIPRNLFLPTLDHCSTILADVQVRARAREAPADPPGPWREDGIPLFLLRHHLRQCQAQVKNLIYACAVSPSYSMNDGGEGGVDPCADFLISRGHSWRVGSLVICCNCCKGWVLAHA